MHNFTNNKQLFYLNQKKGQTRPRGNNFFFMLNSSEREISNAYKNKNTDKWRSFLL